MSTFPVFDLSKFTNAPPTEKKSLGHTVDEICRQTGFLAITGHGIPDETITRAGTPPRAFFDLPVEKKLAVKMRYEGYPYGYSPLQSEALAKSKGEDTPPDIKETFNIGPLTPPPSPRPPATSPSPFFAPPPTSGLPSQPNSSKPGPITTALSALSPERSC